MIKKCKQTLEKGSKFGTIFMDLTKAFDTPNHNLLLVKLNAYDFSFNATFSKLLIGTVLKAKEKYYRS